MCVPNQKIRTKDVRYECMYRYTPNIYLYIYTLVSIFIWSGYNILLFASFILAYSLTYCLVKAVVSVQYISIHLSVHLNVSGFQWWPLTHTHVKEVTCPLDSSVLQQVWRVTFDLCDVCEIRLQMMGVVFLLWSSFSFTEEQKHPQNQCAFCKLMPAFEVSQ